ncbi:MAG TPA: PEP/pyruvate-binding domain-containing protein [bacterium]|nr:PEP/pyruvate-binding domain-containing protein [bacterium]
MRKSNYSPHHRAIPKFDRHFFTSDERFTHIGSGELGGKAHGLAQMHGIVESKLRDAFAPAITVNIPSLTVITTEFFDLFMKENDLYEIAYSEVRDDLIAHAFMKADLPVRLVGDLRALVEQVHTPLAVRSSSMLEDAMFEPFASVYGTKMVPNNEPEPDARFRRLVEAVKLIYASTFFKVARNYMKATHHITRDEKMAVVIQEVVGSRFGDRFYPNVSGVLRSYNFYPVGSGKPEEGVAELALGLGRTIVDDGVSWAFSPSFPAIDPPFKSMGDRLKHTQTRFWAINMRKPAAYDPINEIEFLENCSIAEAEYDGTLRFIASTYVAQDDRIVSGVGNAGPRVLDFAPILKDRMLPLGELLTTTKQVCEDMLGTMVEIEFAMRLDYRHCEPAEFGFLQVRPMVVSEATVDLPAEDLAGDRVLVASEQALGNGVLDTIRDVVYVDPAKFDIMKTRLVASEIEPFNRTLVEARKPYLLIGFGRWGTTDPSAGIPVDFGQISGAKVIVESALPEIRTAMSQGSHFFHNVTSFKIFFFSVPPESAYSVKWERILKQRVVSRSDFVVHAEFERPLSVRVDGRTGRGVILSG